MRAGCREGGSPTWPLPTPRSSARALSRGLAGSGSGICGASSCPLPPPRHPPRQDSRACRTGRQWAPATVGIVETHSSCSEREGVSPSSGGARGAKERCGGCSRRGAALRLPCLPSKVLTRSSFRQVSHRPGTCPGALPYWAHRGLKAPVPSLLPPFLLLAFLSCSVEHVQSGLFFLLLETLASAVAPEQPGVKG